MTERKTVVYPNPEVLAQAVAARTLLTIADLLAEPNRQRVDIAVTGGTDGIYVLKVMGESPLAEAVDWSRVHVWWGDERFVAADSDDRNAKQAREAWFGKLIEDGRMPAENIHEMPADGRSDDEITTATPEQTEAEINDPHVLVVGVRDSPKPPPLRVTLTVPMIAHSKHTWVFTSEERKADAVRAAFARRNNPHAPSSYADGEELLWLIDEDAASKL